MPLAEALALLEPMLADPATIKVGHNVKTLVKAFARHRIAVAPIDDTMLISYALHAAQHGHGLDYLADLYLQHQPATLKSADRQRQGGARASRRCRRPRPPALPRRACRGDLAAALRAQAPAAVRAGHPGLRDAGAAAGAGARDDGGARRPRRPAGAVAALGRLRAADGGAGGGDPRPGRRPVQRRLARSSSARCCSTRWGSAAAARARPAPIRPAPTCSRSWRRRATTCRRGCSTGGCSRS